ncbi:hypothetical protein TSAR_009780 [Trichomalopsis sarcophagae]|uniref:Uncharacterized protein n=1 Tax=Trichomalopsis sarcophagae TaxID=543379 RepID=A0A232EK07_9HYME|nr:hypothetical protein TSAR_009780 [Trichomalopsis sarcophagae]
MKLTSTEIQESIHGTEHVSEIEEQEFRTQQPSIVKSLEEAENSKILFMTAMLINFRMRESTHNAAIQIQLKRHIEHKTNYIHFKVKQLDLEQDENDVLDNYEIDEEVLILDRNKEISEDMHIIVSGQEKTPLSWHSLNDIDELCFPRLFGERVKFESRNRDRRSCIPTRILFMAKKKLDLSVSLSINTCLRKTINSGNNCKGCKKFEVDK